MFSRLEFRWSGDEIKAIAAIQPARNKAPRSGDSRSISEMGTSSELTQRDAETIFLSSIAAIFVNSETTSYKFQTLVRLLRDYFGDPKVKYEPERIAEGMYNKLSILKARPAFIAAVKADPSMLFDSDDDQTRFRKCMDLVGSHAATVERIDGSEIGSEVLFRGNDVMANLNIGSGPAALFKPAEEIQTKEQLYSHLLTLFGLQSDVQEVPNRGIVSMDWIAAEALFAARENIGVTQESIVHILMQRPDRAFLYCYLFGTKNPQMPQEYQTVALRFEQIYQKTRQLGLQNPITLERLRGWTPEHGAKNPEKVNGGFQGDTIFFQEMLFESIDGVKKADPEFNKKAVDAVALVRGEPVLFMDTLRKLADILSRKERNLPFPKNDTTDQWSEVQEQLIEALSSHPQKHRILTGRWFDASAALNPDYQVDQAAVQYYIYANKALLSANTMVQ